MELSGGNRRHRRRSRFDAAATAIVAAALTAVLAACGGGSSSSSDEATRTYPIEISTASFPAEQRLGQTSLMRLGIRNAGEKTMPMLTVTVSVAGRDGAGSTLPFGIRDPQPGLSQPDRPVWVLSEGYPKLDGSEKPGGAESASRKTFVFGPLKADATTEATWKLSASKTGKYTVLYEVGAGLGGKSKAEAPGGAQPGGSFVVEITEATPDLTVTDSGEVVEIDEPQRGAQ